MTRANFFVVGAAKAGTTSLASFLESLPDVFVSPIKEPCHFCPDINLQLRDEMKRQQMMDTNQYFEQGMPFSMHIAHVEKPKHYEMLFANAGEATAIGECSTYYLPSKVAAQKIFNYNPDAKIIAVLRDPISRIQSHYRMDQRMGLERRALDVCIQEEIDLGDTADFTNCRMYLSMSDYADQVERYRTIFGASQLLTIDLNDLQQTPQATLLDVLNFLELPVDNVDLTLPRENSGDKEPRFKTLDRFLYKFGIKRFLRLQMKRLLPETVVATLKSKYTDVSVKKQDALDSSAWKQLPQVLRVVSNFQSGKQLS